MPAAQTILVLAGPTGGHLFPAWAFAEAFKSSHPPFRIILATGRRAAHFEDELRRGPFEAVIYLHDFALRFWPLWSAFKLIPDFLKALSQSGRLLDDEKPALVAGFGSYSSVAAVLLAGKKGIPVLLHEQNKVSGKATAFLMRKARVLAASFEETVPAPPAGQRWQVTGLPIRKSLLDAAASFQRSFERRPVTLLVTGGSQGSVRLNELVVQALSRLTHEETKNLAVIHITGKLDYERVVKSYESLNLKRDIYPFFDKMHALFQQADFAVTRAGANTLFELALFGLPALVVPYPYAGAHQKENALQFEKRGAVLLHDEARLTAGVLARYLQVFISDSGMRRKLSEGVRKIARPQAAAELAEIAAELLEEKI